MQAATSTRPYSYTRLNVESIPEGISEVEREDGRYVLAVDAICREAVLQGRIRELERKLRALSPQRWY